MGEFTFFKVDRDKPIYLDIDMTENSTIYHYTDFKGAFGILESRCLWISRSDVMEDLSEIVHIKVVLKSVYDLLKINFQNYVNIKFDYNSMVLENIMNYIGWLSSKYEPESGDYNIYILSLSEDGDSLALFKEYSKLSGFCFGFDTTEIFNFTQLTHNFKVYNGYLSTAGKIIYDLDQQASIVLKDILFIYNSIYSQIQQYQISIIDQYLYNMIFKEFMHLLIYRLNLYSVFFKNHSFVHENEYRMAFLVPNEIEKQLTKRREKGSINIPYIEFYPENKLPLKSVRISPKTEGKYIEQLKRILEQKEYTSVEILLSDIPIR